MLDTNAAIYYLQDDSKVVQVMNQSRQSHHSFIISTMTELEIFSFSTLDIGQMIEIDQWLGEFTIVPVDSVIAREAARLRRLFKLKAPDAIIAATALRYSVPLLTRDRGFQKVRELKIITC